MHVLAATEDIKPGTDVCHDIQRLTQLQFLWKRKVLERGGGRRYIYDKKVKILHGPSPGVKCVAPLVDTCP